MLACVVLLILLHADVSTCVFQMNGGTLFGCFDYVDVI